MYAVKASESTDWMPDAFSSNSVSSSELQKVKVIKISYQNILHVDSHKSFLTGTKVQDRSVD